MLIKNKELDKYIIRWREEVKKAQKENVPTEMWKAVKEFIKETTLYEVMTGYKEGKEIRGRFKELIERMERWEIEEMRAIEEGKRLIKEIVWEEAYRRFGKLNEIESEAIRKRIRLLQKVWEELIKVMYRIERIEESEIYQEYREIIGKTERERRFVLIVIERIREVRDKKILEDKNKKF